MYSFFGMRQKHVDMPTVCEVVSEYPVLLKRLIQYFDVGVKVDLLLCWD
jgi:hypothetical protein